MTTDTLNSTPNLSLLREIAEWIREQLQLATTAKERLNLARETPETSPDLIWDQLGWADPVFGTECKTTCCVAGYAVLSDPEVDTTRTLQTGEVHFRDSERVTTYSFHARNLLGLTPEQASELFYAGNNPDLVLALLSSYAEEDL